MNHSQIVLDRKQAIKMEHLYLDQQQYLPTQDVRGKIVDVVKLNELSKEELLLVVAQTRQLIHAAAQPLTTILSLSELMLNTGSMDETAVDDINIILEEATALRGIFSKLQGLIPRS